MLVLIHRSQSITFVYRLEPGNETGAVFPLPGILLHFDDSLLSDLYFVNPQWLCSMLANVVTVQERNPFQKNGRWNGMDWNGMEWNGMEF